MKRNYFAHGKKSNLFLITFIVILVVAFVFGAVSTNQNSLVATMNESQVQLSTATEENADITLYAEGTWQTTVNTSYNPASESINSGRAGTFAQPYYIDTAEQLVKAINNASTKSGSNYTYASYNNSNTYFVIRKDIDLGAKFYTVSSQSDVRFNITGYNYTTLPNFANFATSTGFTDGGKTYKDTANPFNAIKQYLDDKSITDDIKNISASGNNFKTVKNLAFQSSNASYLGLFNVFSGKVLALNIYNVDLGSSGNNVEINNIDIGSFAANVKGNAWLGNINAKDVQLNFTEADPDTANHSRGGLIGAITGGDVTLNTVAFDGKISGSKGLCDHGGGLVGYISANTVLFTGKNRTYGTLTANVVAGSIDAAGGFVGKIASGNVTFESSNINELQMNVSRGFMGGFVGSFAATGGTLKFTGESKNLSSQMRGRHNFGGYIGNSYGTVIIENGQYGGNGGASDNSNVGKYTDENTVIITWPDTAAAGGFIGYAYGNVELTNCHNFVDINVERHKVGGLIGIAEGEVTIDSCINHASFVGNYAGGVDKGGIIGHIQGNTTIKNTENYADVAGSQLIGGILGTVSADINNLTISNCTNHGTISGLDGNIGGILGGTYRTVTNLLIKNCTNLGSIYCAYTMKKVGTEKPGGGTYSYEEAFKESSYSTAAAYVAGILGYYQNKNATGGITIEGCVNGALNTDSVLKSAFRYFGGIVGGNGLAADGTGTLYDNYFITLKNNTNYMDVSGDGYGGGLYGHMRGHIKLTIGNPDIDTKIYGNFGSVSAHSSSNADIGSIAGCIRGTLVLVGNNDYKNTESITAEETSTTSGGIIGFIAGTGSNTITFSANWANEADIVTGRNHIGGIIGGTNSADFVISGEMYNTGNIICKAGTDYIGGIIGIIGGNKSLTIQAKVYNEGNVYSQLKTTDSTVSSTSGSIGGIVGHIGGNLEFTQNAAGSYNSGFVYANFRKVGGIAGNVGGTVSMTGVISYENEKIKDKQYPTINIYRPGSDDAEVVTVTSTVFAEAYAGGFIGYMTDTGTTASFTNCINYASVSCTANDVAGFIGQGNSITSLSMVNCINYGDIATRDSWAGGFTGGAPLGVYVENCANYGNISTRMGQSVAGFFSGIGFNEKTAYSVTIKNSFNAGNIAGALKTGGLIGDIRNATTVEITNSYSTGNVSVESVGTGIQAKLMGGLIGRASRFNSLTLSNCYVDCENVGDINSLQIGGLVGYIYYSKAGTANINNCYVDIDTIVASRDVGGAVGGVSSTSNIDSRFIMTDCYFAGESIIGQTLAGGILGYTGGLRELTVQRTACLYFGIEVTTAGRAVSAIAQSLYNVSGTVLFEDIYVTSKLIAANGTGDVSLFVEYLEFDNAYRDLSVTIKNYYFSGNPQDFDYFQGSEDSSEKNNYYKGNVSAKHANYFGAIENNSNGTSYKKTLSIHDTYITKLSQTISFDEIGGSSNFSSTSAADFNPSSTNICDYEFGTGTDNLFVNYSDLQNIDNFNGWGVTQDVRSGSANTSSTPWGIDAAVNDGKPFLIVATMKEINIYYNNIGDDLDIFDNSIIRNVDERNTETVVSIISYFFDTLSYNNIKNGKIDNSNYSYINAIKRVGYNVSELYKARQENGSYLAEDKYTEISVTSPDKVMTLRNGADIYVSYSAIEYTIIVPNGGAVNVAGATNNKFTIDNFSGISITNNNDGQTSSFVYFALQNNDGEYDSVGESSMVLIEGSEGTTSAVYKLNFEAFINQQLIHNYAKSSGGNMSLTFKAMFVAVYKVTFNLSADTFPSYVTVINSSGISVDFGNTISIEAGKQETYTIILTKHYSLVKTIDESTGSAIEGNTANYNYDKTKMVLTITNTNANENYNFTIYVQAIEYTVEYKLYNTSGEILTPEPGDITLATESSVVTVGNVISAQNISINPSSVYKFVTYRYRYTENGNVKTEDIDTQGSTVLGTIVCTADYLDKYVTDGKIVFEIIFESDATLILTIGNIADWDNDYGSVIINIYDENYVMQSTETVSRLISEFNRSFDVGYIIEIIPWVNNHFEITALTLNGENTELINEKLTLQLDSNKTVNIEMDYIKYSIRYSIVDENHTEIDGAMDSATVGLESGLDYVTARGDYITGQISEIAGYGFNAWGIYYMGEFIPFNASDYSTDGSINSAEITLYILDNYIDDNGELVIASRLYTMFDIDVVLADIGDDLGEFEIRIYNDILGEYDDPVNIEDIESLPYLTLIKVTALPGEYYDFRQFIGISQDEINQEDSNIAEFYLTESRTVMLYFEARPIAISVIEDLTSASGELVVSNSSGSSDSWKAGDTLSFTFNGAFGQEIKSFSFNGMDAKELSTTYENVNYANGILTVTMTTEFLETLENNDFNIVVTSQIGTIYLIMLLSIIIIPIVLTILILIFVIINIKRRKKAMEIVAQRKASKSRFEASNMVSELRQGTYKQADRSVSKEEIERQLKARKDNK